MGPNSSTMGSCCVCPRWLVCVEAAERTVRDKSFDRCLRPPSSATIELPGSTFHICDMHP